MSDEQKKAILALLNGLTVKGLEDCRRVVMIESIINSIDTEESKDGEEVVSG